MSPQRVTYKRLHGPLTGDLVQSQPRGYRMGQDDLSTFHGLSTATQNYY